MNTDDCKEIIYDYLSKNNYFELNIDQKKLLVENSFREYIVNKLKRYYGFENVCEHYETNELINYLSDSPCIIPLIKCLISIICQTQDSTIYWIINNNKKEVEINYTKNYIISIYSGKNYSYIFNYLYDYYLNKFDLNNKKHIKQL